ncbi:MAG: hypothetical protein VB042_08590 [Victivallaceae bacterium]|nr:hypothetical protein [Victivallaceae bacterium]
MGTKFNSNPWEKKMLPDGRLQIIIPEWLYFENPREVHIGPKRIPFIEMRFADTTIPTGHLIGAAPKLYGGLKEAIMRCCFNCCDFRPGAGRDYLDPLCGPTVDTCAVKKWIAAIKEADGEE